MMEGPSIAHHAALSQQTTGQTSSVNSHNDMRTILVRHRVKTSDRHEKRRRAMAAKRILLRNCEA